MKNLGMQCRAMAATHSEFAGEDERGEGLAPLVEAQL